MHRPVLVTAPIVDVVTLNEAKAHLRVDQDVDDDDEVILSLIATAITHLEGWTGVLGRLLAEQTWRQDFDCFEPCMVLPLGPVISLEKITWRDAIGVETTVDEESYYRVTDGGREIVHFVDGFAFPSNLARSAGVSIIYKGGYATTPEVPADGETPSVPAKTTVPASIKTAVLMMVANWYTTRVPVTEAERVPLPPAVDVLLGPHRRYTV